MTQFTDLGLDPRLLEALTAAGYTTPTPIQAQAIPSVRDGKDLLGIAQTGTGKTAAFALPILHRLLADARPAPRRGARVLVLSPTRELASQIAESFETYGKNTNLTVGVVFGGVAHRPQAKMLQTGLDVLVATPGRLLDHVSERNIELGQTEILVLDEADQMMDLGFIRPLRQIVSRLAAKRQSLFFSATMPHEIGALAAELLRDPVKVSVTPVAKTADRVAQRVIHVEAGRKRVLLSELFANADLSRVLVFTRTKRGADKVARHLEGAGVQAAAIHGNKSQAQRERALADFKVSKVRALVATDIAARGIDVDQVSHVINFELPNIPESYVHRIGRTARAGAEGIAISLCDAEEREYLRDIERLTRQQIPSEDRRGCKVLAGMAAAEPAPAREQSDERRGGRDNRGNRPRRPSGDGARHGHRNGEERRGDRFGGERTHGDRPHGERSRGDRPHGDRAHGDRPRGDRPRSDRPQYSSDTAPFGAAPRRPEGDRATSDTPRHRDERRHQHRDRASERPRADRDQGAAQGARTHRPREERGQAASHGTGAGKDLANVGFLGDRPARPQRDGKPRFGARTGHGNGAGHGPRRQDSREGQGGQRQGQGGGKRSRPN